MSPWLHVHLNTNWTLLWLIGVVLMWPCVRSIPASKGDPGNGEERLELLRLCLQGAAGRICKVTICSQTLPGQISAGRAQDAAARNVRLLSARGRLSMGP